MRQLDSSEAMTVICELCGEANSPGVPFCVGCGSYLNWQERTGVPDPAADQRATGADVTRPGIGDIPPTHTRTGTADPPPAPVPAPAPVGSGVTCPNCQRPNAAGRRFCTKCGYQLVGGPVAPAPPDTKSSWRRWWERVWDTRDRAARRAYRRSLPRRYRWRRVAVVLVLIGLVVGGGIVTHQRPLAFARDRWSDVFYFDRLRDVPVAAVTVAPTKAGLTDPTALVSNTFDPFSVKWNATTASTQCADPKKTVTLELTFPAARIRQIVIFPGLQNEPERNSEFRPTAIRYAFAGADPCAAQDTSIEDAFKEQVLTTDSEQPVTSVRMVITQAEVPKAEPAQKKLSLTEIRLREREK